MPGCKDRRLKRLSNVFDLFSSGIRLPSHSPDWNVKHTLCGIEEGFSALEVVHRDTHERQAVLEAL